MFSTNQKISRRQVKRMLILDMFSVSFLMIPYIAVRGNGEKGLISLIIGCIFAIIYGTIMYYCGRQLQGESYMSYSRKSIGRIGTILFGILYFIKFLMVYLFAVTLFIYIVGHTLLMETNPKVILVTLLILSGYGGIQELQKKARFAECIYYIVLVPIVIYLLLGIFRVDVANLMMPGIESSLMGEDFFVKSENNLIWSSYLTLLPFTALETILFILPSVNKEKQKRGIYQYILWGVIIIGVLNIFIYCITVGILGVGETGNTLWGTVTIMTLIELPGDLLNRKDGASKQGKRKAAIGIFLLVLIYFGYGYISSVEEAFVKFGEYFAYIGLPQSVLIPLFLLFIWKVSGKNKHVNLKEEQTL